VIQTTLAGLGSVDVRATEPDAVAGLKGDPRLAEVIARAAWGRIGPVTEVIEARTRFGTIRLDAGEVEDRRELALSERRSVEASRTRFRNEVVALAQRRLLERRPEGLKIEDDVHHAVRTSPELRRAIDRLWPATTGAALVRRVLTSPAFLRRFATDVLDAREQRLIGRKGARRRDDEPWTVADVPLVDEAEAVLGIRHRRYGHLVVDEAQDLSPMAWRLLARRCSRFPSMTVLGDLAQATAPAAQRSWDDVIAAVGAPPAVHEAELEIGYRVPGQILDVANRLLPATGAAVRPSRSVRTTPIAPEFVAAEPERLAAEVAVAARELLDRHASVALIGAEPPSLDPTVLDGTDGLTDRLTVLGAADAKGLEFDGVVVVEPAAFVSRGERGARLLYIAMTRAVQELVVVHAEALPAALAEPAASAMMAR
jgi:DNA helicase IV